MSDPTAQKPVKLKEAPASLRLSVEEKPLEVVNREAVEMAANTYNRRLSAIREKAHRVFGNPEKSDRWMRKPNSALSGQTPLELLTSETGARTVDELLGQIDHGMLV